MRTILHFAFAALAAVAISTEANATIQNAVGDTNGNGEIDGQAGNGIILGFSPNELIVPKEYFEIGPMDIQVDVSGQTTFLLDERITNNTGIDWTDFHFELFFESPQTVMFEDIMAGPAGQPFANITVSDTTIDLDGGVLPSGEFMDLILEIESVTSANITIRQTPTIDGNATAPEPSSLVLVLLGGLGLLASARRRAR